MQPIATHLTLPPGARSHAHAPTHATAARRRLARQWLVTLALLLLCALPTTARAAVGPWSITVTPGSNGTITPGTTSGSASPVTRGFAITPNTGYAITEVKADNLSVGTVAVYTFTNITGSHTLSATFGTPVRVVATAGANGSISPAGTTTIGSGATLTYTITPNGGYAIAEVRVDNVSVGTGASYAFINLTTNHTISATFGTPVRVVATAGTNGSVSPAGTTTVGSGATLTYTITPNSGYAITDVKVDNVSVGPVASYIFTNLLANHTLAATFGTPVSVVATAGTGGSITPAGTTTIGSGATLTYTITPTGNYHVLDVVVDNSSVGAITTYHFGGLSTSHTISATFSNTYTIHASGGKRTLALAAGTSFTGGTDFSTSPDGISWTRVAAAVSGMSLFKIAIGHDVAVGVGYGIWTSADGANWTAQSVDLGGQYLTDVIYAGGKFVAVGHTGMIFTSPDGTTWTSQTSGVGGRLQAIDYGNGTYVAVEDYDAGYQATVITSPDAVNWTIRQRWDTSTDHYFSAIVFANGKFVMAGSDFSGFNPVTHFANENPIVFVSSDNGVSWTQKVSSGIGALGDGAYGNGSFVFVGGRSGPYSAGNGTPVMYTSTDGNSWSTQFLGVNENLSAIAYGLNLFILGGTNNTLRTSPDGSTWTARNSDMTLNGGYINQIAVGQLDPPPKNGTITPAGDTAVTVGTSQTYTITPDTGYHIADVRVDGSSIGVVTTYTFVNVTAPHTIAATFAINTYTLTATASANGSVSPAGTTTVNYGTTTTYDITPTSGYHIQDVRVDGSSVGTGSSYTFAAVTTSHTIAAAFSNTYTISANAGGGGNISPLGVIPVIDGATPTFTITPDSGYLIATVIVDGSIVGSGSSYQFPAVHRDHTIRGTFVQAFTIYASAGAGGNVSPAGTITILASTTPPYAITPATGYHVADVQVDGSSVGAVTRYTFAPVSANHTLSASFAADAAATGEKLWGMGNNSNGQLGTGDVSKRSTPVLIANGVAAMGAANTFTLYAQADHTLWATGYNQYGGLGTGDTTDRHTPVQVDTGTITGIACGLYHTLYVKADGTRWAMGGNSTGQLGTGDTTDHSTPIQIDTGVVSVGAGDLFSFYIKTNGSLWSMGGNGLGPLGTGSSGPPSLSPTQAVASGVVQVVGGSNHSMFRKSDGSLWAVGGNYEGQLGAGTTDFFYSSPVKIVASGVVSVAVGSNFSVWVKDDGSLWGAGDNGGGQLGGGGGPPVITPVQIVASGVVEVAAGISHIIYRKSDGSLWGLGRNEDGQLGVGDTTNRSTPVMIVPNGVTAIACGQNFSLYRSTTPTITVTATAGTGGSISPAGTTTMAPGATPTYTITPNSGYRIADVLVDGTSVGTGSNYTFAAVTASHRITATFASTAPTSYTITALSAGNGSITPAGTSTVVDGATPTYTITPNSGYHIDRVLVDGTNVGTSGSYTFPPVHAIHGITAFFAADASTFTIVATTDGNGSITPAGTSTVNAGATRTYVITPATGYRIESVLVDGSSVGAGSTYTFSPVYTDHDIDVTFAVQTYTITATAGANGSVSPLGTSTVLGASTPVYTITPASHYHVASVLVDGSSVGAVTTYTFAPLGASHTLSATFAIDTFTVVIKSGGNGSVTAGGTTTVAYGATVTSTPAAAGNYHFVNWTIAGGTVVTMPYTVTAAVVLTANFASNTNIIYATAGAGGTITPANSVGVASGATQTFTITPSTGFRVNTITVDGSVQAPPAGGYQALTPSTYVFPNVQAPHTIAATFTAACAVIVEAAGGGSPTGTLNGDTQPLPHMWTVPTGTNVSLVVTGSSGWTFYGFFNGSGAPGTTPAPMATGATSTTLATFVPGAISEVVASFDLTGANPTLPVASVIVRPKKKLNASDNRFFFGLPGTPLTTDPAQLFAKAKDSDTAATFAVQQFVNGTTLATTPFTLAQVTGGEGLLAISPVNVAYIVRVVCASAPAAFKRTVIGNGNFISATATAAAYNCASPVQPGATLNSVLGPNAAAPNNPSGYHYVGLFDASVSLDTTIWDNIFGGNAALALIPGHCYQWKSLKGTAALTSSGTPTDIPTF